jgi:hypothetical protein
MPKLLKEQNTPEKSDEETALKATLGAVNWLFNWIAILLVLVTLTLVMLGMSYRDHEERLDALEQERGDRP